jgi:hypothetical protein
MRLSEAIRLGAMLRPQVFHAFRTARGTCAFGAAVDAVGLTLDASDPAAIADALIGQWPWLQGKRVRCPECTRRRVPGAVISECLNDEHRWTRERIADWVETLEPAAVPVCDVGTGEDVDACSPAGDLRSPSQRATV